MAACDAKIMKNKFTEENRRKLKRDWVGKFPPDGSIEKVNTILLRNTIFYARNLLLQNQACEGDEFIKKNYFQPTFRFSQRILNLVIKYSQFTLPVDPEEPIKDLKKRQATLF